MPFQVWYSSVLSTYTFTTENCSLYGKFILNPPGGIQRPEQVKPDIDRHSEQHSKDTDISVYSQSKTKLNQSFLYILQSNFKKRKRIKRSQVVIKVLTVKNRLESFGQKNKDRTALPKHYSSSFTSVFIFFVSQSIYTSNCLTSTQSLLKKVLSFV